MQCDKAMERLLDSLAGEGSELDDQTRSHIVDCPVCSPRAARYRALWDDLGRLEVPGEQSSESEERIARRLSDAFWARARAELATSGGAGGRARVYRRSHALLAAAALAALILGAIGGYLLAPQVGPAVSQPVASDAEQRFLLLLHESPDLRARFALGSMDSVVAEYRMWANELAARGKLVGAAKLEDDVRFVDRAEDGLEIERRGPEQLGDMVTGYFVIHAADYEEALEVTAGAPHLRYGGTIEVRAIDQGS